MNFNAKTISIESPIIFRIVTKDLEYDLNYFIPYWNEIMELELITTILIFFCNWYTDQSTKFLLDFV